MAWILTARHHLGGQEPGSLNGGPASARLATGESSLPLRNGSVHLACRGEAKVDVIQRLLADPRIDVNAKGSEKKTILSWCLSRLELEDIALSLYAAMISTSMERTKWNAVS
jgi:hypothetical protein